MSDPSQPIGRIKPQRLSTLPFPIQNVLCDDPVALCDDPVALCGGQMTQTSNLVSSTDSNAPKASIHSRR